MISARSSFVASAVLALCFNTARTRQIELPNGRSVQVVDEIVPQHPSSAVYVLVYRTTLGKDDCAVVKELAEVWSHVRSKAEQSKARVVVIVAERAARPSNFVSYLASKEGGWKQAQKPVGCEAPAR